MSRYHGWPLSRHRTAGLLLVVLLLVSLDVHIGAQPLLPQTAASVRASASSPTCAPSATTATPSPTCAPSATTATPSPTVESDQLTPSISAAALITETTPTITPTETPTSSPSATSFVTPSVTVTQLPTTTPAPLQTPTPAPTPSDGVMCPPGTEIVFTGEGPTRSAVLLAFDQRIVGGGSIDAGGHFRIPLTVGNERPGYYAVTVQVRGTEQVLRRWTCIVPEFTPTHASAEFIPTATQTS